MTALIQCGHKLSKNSKRCRNHVFRGQRATPPLASIPFTQAAAGRWGGSEEPVAQYIKYIDHEYKNSSNPLFKGGKEHGYSAHYSAPLIGLTSLIGPMAQCNK